MNWLDIVLIILLVSAAVSGLFSGLIKMVLSLAGLVVGVIIAGRTYIPLAENLTFISNESAARVVAFALIFLAVILIAFLLGIILTRLVSAILLGWLNRVGGAFFGLLLGAFFISAILTLWVKYIGAGDTIITSGMASFLLDRFPMALALLPEEFASVHEFFR